MVGGLVEQQHVGLLQKQAAECHTTALATREVGNGPIARRTTEGCHRAVQFGVHIPRIGGIDDVLHLCLPLHELVHLVGIAVVFFQSKLEVDVLILLERVVHLLHTLLHILLHGLGLIEGRVLRQVTHRIAGAPHHFALRGLLYAGDDLHQRRLTRAVETDDSDFCTIEEREINVLQYLLLVLWDNLGYSHHREDNLLVVYCCHVLSVCDCFSMRPNPP